MMDIENSLELKIEKLTANTIDKMRAMKRVRLSEAHLSQYGHFEGCTQEEIAELMQAQNVKLLPTLYQNLLLHSGRRNGGIVGLLTHKELKVLKQNAIQMLSVEQAPMNLPEDAFVFFADAGSYFLFFCTAVMDANPPVFRYHEGDKQFERIADSLSRWLEDRIAGIEAREIT